MIVVLTYNIPHRKTQDLLYQIKLKTDKEILVIGSPMKYVKKLKPLIAHRPSKAIQVDNKVLCDKLGFKYEEVPNDLLLDRLNQVNPEFILIAGAGLLDTEIVNKFIVVNCHPGKLPDVRGLDALKWAIYNGKDIGITLHIVDETADGGLLIKEEIVPLYPYDTFHSIAYRQYEMEIELLSDAIHLLKDIKNKDEFPKINIADTIANKRMDIDKEKELYSILNERLNRLKDEEDINED